MRPEPAGSDEPIKAVPIRPGVSVLSILRHLNYKTWFALAEFVDNAVQSYLANKDRLEALHGPDFRLKVDIIIEPAMPSRIVIRDNAAGIALRDFPRAFRPAAIPPDRSGLSEFGMGMKSAACWFAPRWSARTKALDESAERMVRFDVAKIVRDQLEELEIAETPSPTNAHFTEIVLDEPYHLPAGRTVGKIKDHLTDIYRVYIRDGILELRFNTDLLEYSPPRILTAPYVRKFEDGTKEWMCKIEFDFGEGLSVTGFAGLMDPMNTNRSGFALFRRKRLIEGSGDEGYRPPFIFGQPGNFRWRRLFGELHLEGFEVSHTKDGFRWDENEQPFLELLREKLDGDELPMLRQADLYRVQAARNELAEAAQKAITRAVEAMQATLPEALPAVASEQPVETTDIPLEPEPATLAARELTVSFRDQKWLLRIALTSDPAQGDWLVVSDQPARNDGVQVLEIRLSLVHPFMVSFAQTDPENVEALLRVAAGLALSEKLARGVGVKMVGTIRRNLNELLREALAKPQVLNMSSGSAIVTPLNPSRQPGANWNPHIGEEAQELVTRKLAHESDEARRAVLSSAASILSKSVDPQAETGSETGLVVGYVQSGKTLSFSTVMALARDNGFQLVIVVAGTSKLLLKQSTDRLRNDLQIDKIEGLLKWKLLTGLADNETNRRHIQQTLGEWSDPDVAPSERATVLITVMKQHTWLRKLVSLLSHLDLTGVPTLIIDDEADQASLNTLVRQQRQSTTYQRLLDLRDAIPHHTFLQYTATPQAPLLINIIDTLSPSFVEVLEPGTGYVGGQAFFSGNMPLIRVIAPEDISTDDNPLMDPPEPLREALRVFLLGVAAGLVEGRSARNLQRSMLVHPSQRTDSHAEYWRWIGGMFDDWQRVLELADGDADKQDLLGEFRQDYAELAATGHGLPSFEDLARRLPRAFRNTKIEQVNARSGKTPEIDWSQSYGWILVGGQSMDRGFTVEGLTVTYMPRGPGLGHADTVQQRGRFFGYKQRYLGFCRVYLEQDALNAFEDYVAHEEDMRRQLQAVQLSGDPLRAWKRAFVLSPDLQACRRNIIDYEYVRGNYSNQWFYPSIAEAPDEVLDANRETTTNYIAALDLVVDPDLVDREPAQRHKVCRELSLAQVVSDLIVPFRVTGAADSRNLVGVMLQLSKALEDNGDERCTVYQVSPEFARSRTIDANGKINELFQGATRLASGGYSYPGDAAFRDDDTVTIQLHTLQLRRDNNVVAENVPVISIWIPRRLELDWVSQHQLEQDG